MFVFLSSVRWQVKSLFCCGRRSLAGPFCSEDRTEVHWYAFRPAPVFCCLVFDIDRKPMLRNRMQWVSSQQEAKTLAISSRRQTPVLHLCHTELRCISSAFSQHLFHHIGPSFCFIFLRFKVFHLPQCHQRVWLRAKTIGSAEVLLNLSCLQDQSSHCDWVFQFPWIKEETEIYFFKLFEV